MCWDLDLFPECAAGAFLFEGVALSGLEVDAIVLFEHLQALA